MLPSKEHDPQRCGDHELGSFQKGRHVEEEDHVVKKKPRCENREDAGAWFLLARVCLFNAITSLNFSSFGFLYVEYTTYFDAPKADVGWVPAIQSTVQSFATILVSPLVERWGCAKVGAMGSFLLALGTGLASLASNVSFLQITQGFIGGVGLSMTLMPSVIIIQQHFTRSRALANGVGMLGWSFGYIAGPIIMQTLLEAFSWRGTLLMMSAILLHRVPLALSFWAPQNPPKASKNLDCSGRLKAMFDFSVLRHPAFVIFWWSEFFAKIYIVAFPNHLPSYTIHNGYTIGDATTFASLIYIFNTVFRVLLTFVSDFFNRVLLYFVGTLFGVLAISAMLLMKSYEGLIVASVFSGAVIGVCNTLPVVILVDFLGVESLTKTFALLNIGVGISSLIATPLCGFIFDMTMNYDLSFLAIGCAALLGAATCGVAWVLHGPSIFLRKNLTEDHNKSCPNEQHSVTSLADIAHSGKILS
ncbi:hypothetical protein CAPTEDRAFT_228136 [Capitella teleta]|uniref:Major facilitator superfamily (MFS) profile domain-containing protein n=1 Tax=Capitella teleta TaxID=283909 RepID=R7UP32_CAPTE|nr:hypothetical protein CAPTEDRAFT_228136 [Capitella teleta]|eukprot:ELU05141.1 hypothetical protein CAPTEDRAFT_228136 [Capitella teleta]